MILADAASVFIEGRVEHPVQRVLDAPVMAYGVRQATGIRRKAADLVTPFARRLARPRAERDCLPQAASASLGVWDPA